MTRPLRGVVFCSGSASSFRYLHTQDVAFGKRYQIVGVFSDVPAAQGIAYAKVLEIPTLILDFQSWCRVENVSRTDLVGRIAYYALVSKMIGVWEPDFIMLSGSMLIVTDPLLTEYSGRMLNVHPALLSIVGDDGKRRYTGLNVVERAMDAGDPTGSTVHLLTAEPDMGPIVAESSPLPYKPWDDPKEHQDAMKFACDGPAFQAALKKLIDSGWPAIPWSR